MSERVRGKVKWYNEQKGFGFIVADDTGKDVFVHKSQVEKIGLKRLYEQQLIEFKINEFKGRAQATDLNIPK